ncbi:biopolymer transport protein ExbB [Gammaproteobacteria bacterium]|nr:biopolymer transport protein ExbB [Gammaproteobacteria bacterium]
MPTSEETLGFTHFIAQADFVSKSLLAVLIIMSLISWTIIILRVFQGIRLRKQSHKFLDFFWHAEQLESIQSHIDQNGIADPFSHLAIHAINADQHHQRFTQKLKSQTLQVKTLEDRGTAEAFLTRSLRKVLDEEASLSEHGLTLLATISATAPFVGLFGTVWGIYHALLAISISGAGTIDKVAGPVGEALIMTAVGLAVAVPAVVAYNWFSRQNRVLLGKLESFACELLTLLSTGELLKGAKK